jgi:hypothetical protein
MKMPEIICIEWQNKFETEDACMKALVNGNTPTCSRRQNRINEISLRLSKSQAKTRHPDLIWSGYYFFLDEGLLMVDPHIRPERLTAGRGPKMYPHRSFPLGTSQT